MNTNNKEPDGSWIFDKMSADELRTFIEVSTKLNNTNLEIISKLEDRCSIFAELVNNLQTTQELMIDREKAINKIMSLDTEMNNKYMDEFFTEHAKPKEDDISEGKDHGGL